MVVKTNRSQAAKVGLSRAKTQGARQGQCAVSQGAPRPGKNSSLTLNLPSTHGANPMTDLIYIAVMAGTFIVGGLYTVFCGKL
jgi:hypothetical protein